MKDEITKTKQKLGPNHAGLYKYNVKLVSSVMPSVIINNCACCYLILFSIYFGSNRLLEIFHKFTPKNSNKVHIRKCIGINLIRYYNRKIK